MVESLETLRVQQATEHVAICERRIAECETAAATCRMRGHDAAPVQRQLRLLRQQLAALHEHRQRMIEWARGGV